jgi:hypothetical protein
VANHGFSGHRERGLDEVKEQNLVIRVYDEAGNVIETDEHTGESGANLISDVLPFGRLGTVNRTGCSHPCNRLREVSQPMT